MKRICLFSAFFIILIVACFDPPPEDAGIWLDDLITSAENGTDTSYAQAIWSYEYNGQTVYYVSEYFGWGLNHVYDSSGTQLGEPDGGWRNGGDGNLTDFFETAGNKTLIWTCDFPDIDGADEEYQILNAVLRSRFYDRNYLHVVKTTFGYTEFFSYQYKLDDSGFHYDTLMLGDFLIKNTFPLTLNEIYLIDPVHTVYRADLDAIWTNYNYPDDWQEYYRRYPLSCGIIELSRPGFSSDGNMVVMKLGWQFGGDAGQGYLIILEKIDGQWMVRWWFDTWIS